MASPVTLASRREERLASAGFYNQGLRQGSKKIVSRAKAIILFAQGPVMLLNSGHTSLLLSEAELPYIMFPS
jgi:hypothetical protein